MGAAKKDLTRMATGLVAHRQIWFSANVLDFGVGQEGGFTTALLVQKFRLPVAKFFILTINTGDQVVFAKIFFPLGD